MEMNTRIQVEHTITEEVIDYDLIKEQIKLAAGRKNQREGTTSQSFTASNAASTRKTLTATGRPAQDASRTTMRLVGTGFGWTPTPTRGT